MVVVVFWMAMAFLWGKCRKEEKMIEEKVLDNPAMGESGKVTKAERLKRDLNKRRRRKRQHDNLKLRSSQSYVAKRMKLSCHYWLNMQKEDVIPNGGKRKDADHMEGIRKRGRWEEEEEEEEGAVEIQEMSDDFMEFPMTPFDFAFLHFLGRGAYGEVLLAARRDTNQLVAVKVMKKDFLNTTLILKERRILETAAKSPFLCGGLAAFQTQTHAFLVMPFMLGGTLSRYLKKRGHLEISEAKFYSAETVCGLLFLHSNGIIHRDIKPENILLDNEGHIRIADFGLVAEQITGRAMTCGATGTSSYMAPEVKSNKHYGTSADWWSFGITLYQLLTGNLPFGSDRSRECFKNHCCEAMKPDFPEWLSKESIKILSELLEYNPQIRLGVDRNVKVHPFYNDINWPDLEAKTVQPPYQPQRHIHDDLMLGMEERYFSVLESETSDFSSGDSQENIPDLSFTCPLWRAGV